MIGEVVLPPERAVTYYGEDLREAHLPHNFALTQLEDWSAEGVRAAVERHEAAMPAGAWPNWLLGDHDFPRIASRLGPERGRLALMLLLTLRGTPTCYYGDEIGMVDATFRGLPGVSDPQAETGGDRDRLLVRTPMQWSSEPHAGFSSVEPWLPVASSDPALTVERQRDDPASVLSLFRSLILMRRDIPALAVGTYRSLPAPAGVFSFERGHPDGVGAGSPELRRPPGGGRARGARRGARVDVGRPGGPGFRAPAAARAPRGCGRPTGSRRPVGVPAALGWPAAACCYGSAMAEEGRPDRGWTFVTNHFVVLLCIAENPDVRMSEVAARVGVTERAVQRLVADLVEAGYLVRSRRGRRNHYTIDATMPLRHLETQHRQLGELVALLRHGEEAAEEGGGRAPSG